MQGKATQLTPYRIDLEKDKNYAYCTCGLSENQPFCDGTHKGSEFKPEIFQVEESKTYAICGCRQSSKIQFCDGTHKNIVEE